MPKKPGPPSSFKQAYCEEIVKYLAEGHTIAAFAGHIGVGLRTVYDWLKRHPEFADAHEIAKLKSLAFWEDRLLDASKGDTKAAPAVLIFGLKNRGPEHWRDVQSLEHTGKDGGAVAHKVEITFVEAGSDSANMLK